MNYGKKIILKDVLLICSFIVILLFLFYKVKFPKREKPSPFMSFCFSSEILALKFHVEPSGLALFPKGDKYILVSDDVPKIRNRILPWVYLLDLEGNLSPLSVILPQNYSFSDLEAVAIDNKNNVYLLCSQSISPKGRLPIKRECFLKGKITRNKIWVKNVIFLRKILFELFNSLPFSKRQEIFCFDKEDQFNELNIEALDWYNQSLYLGLASPTENKFAFIWEIKNPEKLFKTGQLDPSELICRFKVDTGGEGISALTFLVDGSLVFTTGQKSGGNLWIIKKEKISSFFVKPLKIVSWPYNPEGLAPRLPHSKEVIVVFDIAKKAPLWTIVDLTKVYKNQK